MVEWTRENIEAMAKEGEKRLTLYPDLLAFVKRVADPSEPCPSTMVSEARELVRRAEDNSDG